MRQLLWEGKKNPIPAGFLLGLLVVLLFLNWAVAEKEISRLRAGNTEEYYRGQDRAYATVEGTITTANMEWVVSEKNRLDTLILGGDFSTEEDPEHTYTGYAYSDYHLFQKLYADAEYAYNYGAFSADVVEKAQDNLELYRQKGSEILEAYYGQMAQSFRNRWIPAFYRTDGWDSYFSYSFSNLLIMLFLIVTMAPLFSQERENGMTVRLRMTPTGVWWSRIYKILMACLSAFGVTVLFSVQDYLIFANAYGFRGLSNPVYSVQAFRTTGLHISLGGYVVCNFIMKMVGIWGFLMGLLLLSATLPNSILSFGSGCGALLASILLQTFCPILSCLPLMNSITLCSEFHMTATRMPLYAEHLLTQISIAYLLVLILFLTDRRRNRRAVPGGV